MNVQRVLLATGSLVVIALVIIVVIQYRQLEHFMDITKKMNLTGEMLEEKREILDAALCESECKKNPACKAAVINRDGRCLLKSTIGNLVGDENASALRFPCEIYDGTDFQGRGISLDVGRYDFSDLQNRGLRNNTTRSIKILRGYKVTVYNAKGFGGRNATFTISQPDLGVVIRDGSKKIPLTWADALTSIVVEQDNGMRMPMKTSTVSPPAVPTSMINRRTPAPAPAPPGLANMLRR